LGRVELLALGSEEASDEQIDLLLQQLDLLTLSLILSPPVLGLFLSIAKASGLSFDFGHSA
jgi:hypothetical protein